MYWCQLVSTLNRDQTENDPNSRNIKKERNTYIFVLVIIIYLHSCSAESPQCPSGWFGEKCMFKCKCAGNVSCSYEGFCPKNQCHSNRDLSYFGPSCQYYDLAAIPEVLETNSKLSDHDDKSCIRIADTTVYLNWTSAQAFFWIRVVSLLTMASHFRTPPHYEIAINGVPCYNMKEIRVDNAVMDIYCSNNHDLKSVALTGPTNTPYELCSVYVSGGRNVAIKQNASQSSLNPEPKFKGLAKYAVDGRSDPDFPAGMSCSCTSNEPYPWWTLHYNPLVILLKMTILNRNNNQGRLANFKVSTYSDMGRLRDVVYGSGTLSLYTLFLTSDLPIATLRITLPRTDTLTLCEVRTFGETWCPDGTFGLWCQHQCGCGVNQPCNLVSGACFTFCPKGKYGLKCSETCRNTSQCAYDICHDRHGSCILCKAGYSGLVCEDDCPSGTYGQNCTSDCSSGCLDVCDHITGHCSCGDPAGGHTCAVSSMCPKGTFGKNCDSNCSIGCADNCHYKEGTCNCHPKFIGPKCDACADDSSYGPGCTLRCSIGCTGKCGSQDGSCTCQDLFHGHTCSECVKGRHGTDCSQSCPENCGGSGECRRSNGECLMCKDDQHTRPFCAAISSAGIDIWIWLLVLGLLLLVLCIVFCLLWRRKRAAPAAEAPAPVAEEAEEKPFPAEGEPIQIVGSTVDLAAQHSPSVASQGGSVIPLK